MIKGLYIHIPFCDKICTYCDFAKLVAKDELKERYIDTLLKELVHYRSDYSNLETIYIGGGTPSSLDPKLLESLLKTISETIALEQIQEWTIEANPNDISKDLLELITSYGVNRISLGVQTTNDRLLKELNRTHVQADVLKAISLIESSKISNYNLDFIYGIPGQTQEDVEADLVFLLRTLPPHISYYSLIIEENTKLHYDILQHKFMPIDEDIVAEYQEWIEETLTDARYQKYEISNYSKNCHFSKHNLLYWDLEEYLGIGMAAASQYTNSRFVNPRKISDYIRTITDGLFERTVEPFDGPMEFLLMGLRKTEGILMSNYIDRFGKNPLEEYPGLKKYIKTKHLISRDGRLYFSKKGMMVSNQIFLELF
ncbi:MAG: radical SAM family heme chaperone HemW [Bacilli bacterium]|nr:radical SAM family heme chaperone HemW [Bacilli bacterium]MBN2877506.1 radical SAM family heme chaperone HemW [Bacilli bacterium]